MKFDPTRADILRGIAAAGGIAAIGRPARATAADLPKLSYGDIATGVTGVLSANLIAKRFDLKHGVDLSNVVPYTAVTAYYNDFAAGTFDVALGSWDFFIDMYEKGVPLKLVCTLTTADMINIIAGPSIKNMTDLEGKGMSAVIGSGSYAMSRAVLRQSAKIDLDKDVQAQNAPSPAGCVALLQAGSVVAALTWEPNISNAIALQPSLRTIFNLGHVYRTTAGGVLPYFCVAIRAEALKKYPGVAQQVAGAFGDTVAYINTNTTDAFNAASARTGFPASVMHTGFDAKRLVFSAYSMNTPAGKKVVADAYGYMHARGMFEKPLSPDFFA